MGHELNFNVQGDNMGVLVMYGEGGELNQFHNDPMFGMENIIWCWASD